MSKLLKLFGIVLSRKNTAEGDIIIDLFTTEMGRLSVLAKGAAKGSVRFGGALNTFVVGYYDIYSKMGVNYLKNVTVKHAFFDMLKDKDACYVAFDWLYSVKRVCCFYFKCDKLCKLLLFCLGLLEESTKIEVESKKAKILKYISSFFYWQWMKLWGVAPDVKKCIFCGRKLLYTTEDCVMFLEEGLVCSNCFTKVKKTKGLSLVSDEIRFLKLLDNKEIFLKLMLKKNVRFLACLSEDKLERFISLLKDILFKSFDVIFERRNNCK